MRSEMTADLVWCERRQTEASKHNAAQQKSGRILLSRRKQRAVVCGAQQGPATESVAALTIDEVQQTFQRPAR